MAKDAAPQYDAVVIGAGQAGVPLAKALAKAGRRTALIESTHVGGTCVNEGCTPTKTMVASARVAYLARRGADYGVQTGPVTVDLARVRQRKRDIVDEFRGGNEQGIAETKGLDLVRGTGRFTDAHSLVVQSADGEQRLTADWIFLNTGAHPTPPDVPGLEGLPVLDSTSIMELDSVPEHLLVLGGSYIALEFAQMFRRFGSQVTVIQRSARLLGREDPDVADAVAAILREDGLEVLLNTKTVRGGGKAGALELTVQTPDGKRVLHGSHLLAAIGRTPNSAALDLPAAGVQTDGKGFIPVNGKLETNVPGIWALGDVNGGPAFTHIAYDDYRIICANLLTGGSVTTTDRLVPYTVFIDPQLGRVGLSETAARAAGRNIRVATMGMDSVARALETAESRGLMKAVVDADTEQILG
ncbi:MAG: mercuric reductase, partial [Chloroflexota bacterium]|nr:mercuric reductase [Chloroflexota bacterium]